MKRAILSTFLAILFLTAIPLPSRAEDDRLEKLSSEHRKWLVEEVVYIILDRERDVFLSVETVDDRNRFIEAFWRKRDPNRATPENEFKEEHYRRVGIRQQVFRAGNVPEGMANRSRRNVHHFGRARRGPAFRWVSESREPAPLVLRRRPGQGTTFFLLSPVFQTPRRWRVQDLQSARRRAESARAGGVWFWVRAATGARGPPKRLAGAGARLPLVGHGRFSRLTKSAPVASAATS